jgi:DNA helicase MCM9
LEVLHQYVVWVRGAVPGPLPVCPAAEELLLSYYQLQRRSEERTAARTSIRLLQSLVRLAQVRGA